VTRTATTKLIEINTKHNIFPLKEQTPCNKNRNKFRVFLYKFVKKDKHILGTKCRNTQRYWTLYCPL